MGSGCVDVGRVNQRGGLWGGGGAGGEGGFSRQGERRAAPNKHFHMPLFGNTPVERWKFENMFL